MVTIKFQNKKYIETGLRTIVTSGTVEYTTVRGVYRIPNYVASILDKKKIPFVCVKEE